MSTFRPIQFTQDQMLEQLNELSQQLSRAFSRGLTFGENLATQIVPLEFTSHADFDPMSPTTPADGWPMRVGHTLPGVVGVVPISCRRVDRPAGTANGAPVVDWEPGEGQAIRVLAVWGLAPGVRHTMKLLLISG